MTQQIPSFRRHPGIGKLETPRIQFLEFKTKDAGHHVAWGLIERIENIFKDDINGPIDRAELELYFLVLKSDGEEYSGVFKAGYLRNFGNPSVSLSSFNNSQGGYIDTGGFKGHRLGTYLMSEVVRWANHWPEARVETITLLNVQATDENKERRNKFYDRLNIKFNFADKNMRCGESKPMLVSDLRIADSELWAGQIDQLDFFKIFLTQRQELSLLKLENQSYLDKIDDLENEIRRPKTVWERILRNIFNFWR